MSLWPHKLTKHEVIPSMTQLSDRVKNSGLTAKEQAVVEKILSDISNTDRKSVV